jgi:hypothetical protein
MATKNVQIKLNISPEVKADMDLLYNSKYNKKSKDNKGRWRVAVSQNEYWQRAIEKNLQSGLFGDLLRRAKAGQIK